MVVHKYALPTSPRRVELTLPKGAQIVSFQLQDGVPTLWVLHERPSPYTWSETRRFVLVETGQDIVETGQDISDVSPHLNPVGTVQLDGGNYVLHLIEITGR